MRIKEIKLVSEGHYICIMSSPSDSTKFAVVESNVWPGGLTLYPNKQNLTLDEVRKFYGNDVVKILINDIQIIKPEEIL